MSDLYICGSCSLHYTDLDLFLKHKQQKGCKKSDKSTENVSTANVENITTKVCGEMISNIVVKTNNANTTVSHYNCNDDGHEANKASNAAGSNKNSTVLNDNIVPDGGTDYKHPSILSSEYVVLQEANGSTSQLYRIVLQNVNTPNSSNSEGIPHYTGSNRILKLAASSCQSHILKSQENVPLNLTPIKKDNSVHNGTSLQQQHMSHGQIITSPPFLQKNIASHNVEGETSTNCHGLSNCEKHLYHSPDSHCCFHSHEQSSDQFILIQNPQLCRGTVENCRHVKSAMLYSNTSESDAEKKGSIISKAQFQNDLNLQNDVNLQKNGNLQKLSSTTCLEQSYNLLSGYSKSSCYQFVPTVCSSKSELNCHDQYNCPKCSKVQTVGLSSPNCSPCKRVEMSSPFLCQSLSPRPKSYSASIVTSGKSTPSIPLVCRSQDVLIAPPQHTSHSTPTLFSGTASGGAAASLVVLPNHSKITNTQSNREVHQFDKNEKFSVPNGSVTSPFIQLVRGNWSPPLTQHRQPSCQPSLLKPVVLSSPDLHPEETDVATFLANQLASHQVVQQLPRHHPNPTVPVCCSGSCTTTFTSTRAVGARSVQEGVVIPSSCSSFVMDNSSGGNALTSDQAAILSAPSALPVHPHAILLDDDSPFVTHGFVQDGIVQTISRDVTVATSRHTPVIQINKDVTVVASDVPIVDGRHHVTEEAQDSSRDVRHGVQSIRVHTNSGRRTPLKLNNDGDNLLPVYQLKINTSQQSIVNNVNSKPILQKNNYYTEQQVHLHHDQQHPHSEEVMHRGTVTDAIPTQSLATLSSASYESQLHLPDQLASVTISSSSFVSDPPSLISSDSNLQSDQSASVPVQQSVQPRPPKTATQRKYCTYDGCKFSAQKKKDFFRHVRTHTGERPFSCSDCGRRFSRKDKLTSHEKLHLSGEQQRPHPCPHDRCTYRALDPAALRKHIRKHTNERPYKCQVCAYSAKDQSQLVVHIRKHTGDLPFTCLLRGCDASFRTSSDLKRHQRVHTHDRAFSCRLCNHTAPSRGALNSHLRSCHQHALHRPVKTEFFSREVAPVAPPLAGSTSEALVDDPAPVCQSPRQGSSTIAPSTPHTELLETDGAHRDSSCGPVRVGRGGRRKGRSMGGCRGRSVGGWSMVYDRNYKCQECPLSFVRKDSYRAHERVHQRQRTLVLRRVVVKEETTTNK